MGSSTGAGQGGARSSFLRRVVVAAVTGSVVGAAVFATVATTASGPSATPGSGTPSGAAHATTASETTRLAQLPLAFAQGTTTTPSFVAGAPGYDVQITPTQVDLAVARGTGSGAPGQGVGTAPSVPARTTTSQVHLDLVGADPSAPLSTQGVLPGHVNMFVGPRQSWRSDLPTYSTVVAHHVWPGVDVRYGGNSGNLEYTLTVAPGTDPSIARLRLTGVTGLHVDSRGDLVGQSATGPVTERSLQAWQVIDGHRHAVPASYHLDGTTVSFQVGSYDRSRPLVIDPTVVTGYATYLSGGPISEVLGLATDQAGNTYAVGFAGSTGFPTAGSRAYGGGLTDAVVTELDPTGTNAVFSTFLGGMGADVATAVALGPSGSIYVAGYTDSPDFPIVRGTPNTNDNNTILGAENDGFLTVLAAGGSTIDASTLIGGSGEDEIEALAVDASGNAHIAGLTTWNDFPGMGGTPGTSADFNEARYYLGNYYRSTGSFAFVATVDDTAGGLVLGPVTNLGNRPHFEVDALTLDSSGDAFVAGGASNALTTVGGAYSGSTSVSNHDGGFVAEVAPAGTVTWLAWMGTAMQLYGITLDAAGNVDVVGAAYPGLATTPGAVDPTNTTGGPQAMAASLSPNGATLRWATYLGGTNGTSEADAVVVAPDGSLLVTGGTASTTGVATAGAPQATYGGGASDAFLVDLAPDASAVDWGTYLGGPGADWAMSMSPVPGGVAIGGLASPPSFPVSAGSPQTTPAPSSQAGFVADVLMVPTVTSVSPATGPSAGGTTLTVDGTGFTGATAVHVGSTSASFTVVSDTQLTVTTPAGAAGTVDVTVTGPGGTSATSTADHFTYVAAPTVTSVAPASGPLAGGTTLTVDGTGFTGATAVHVGGAAAPFTVVSDTQLTVTTPAGAAGTVDVTVTGPGGTSATSTADHFTYVATAYRLVAADGGVFAFGSARYTGSCPAPGSGCAGVSDIVGAATTPDGTGYWLVGADGAVYPFGTAASYGSMAGHHLDKPMVGMAATPDGKGYWLVAADGGVFAFGDAAYAGSEGGEHLDAPVVGMAAAPGGTGYWLVAADGGVFAFGSARYAGSCPAPGSVCAGVSDIVGAAATPDGRGYWLVGADGAVYPFGTAASYGSMAGHHLDKPMVGMTATPDGTGYWLVAADGGVFAFGDATFAGSEGGTHLDAPVVGVAVPAVRAPV